jgi:hypothetical protein
VPRKGKGSKAEGSPQTAYGQRSDLNDRGPQPITVAPGEPYGQRKMLEDSQRAVPMGSSPVATPPNVQPPVAEKKPVEPGSIDLMAPATPPPNAASGVPVNADEVAKHRVADFLGQVAGSPYATQTVRELAAIAKLTNT